MAGRFGVPRERAEQLIADLRTCPIPELARLGRTLHAWLAELCVCSDGLTGFPDAIDVPARTRPGLCRKRNLLRERWPPRRIRATVTDIGGIMSHAAIVCREYGLPAVTGTASSTARIRTGQRIRVDGNTGTVTILDEDGVTDT